MRAIDWDRPDWGGHVHDPNGSWVPDSPKEEV